jgi:hypothetical protein
MAVSLIWVGLFLSLACFDDAFVAVPPQRAEKATINRNHLLKKEFNVPPYSY